MSIEHSSTSGVHKFAYVQSSDPGPVGAFKGWVDITSGPPYQLKVRNIYNTAWDNIGDTMSSSFANGFNTLQNYDGTLAGAISAIGTTNKVILSIVEPITVSTSINVPANIQLDVRSIITLGGGVILTINSLVDPGNRQIFNTTALSSRIKLSKGAVQHNNVAWWAGTVNNTDITKAIEQARLNCVDNLGGIIYIPEGQFFTSGGHIIADATIIKGSTNFSSSGFGGTNIKLQSPSTNYMWKIGEGENGIRFKNIQFTGNGTTNKIGILCEGTYPNTSGDMSLSHVTIEGFNTGFSHNSLGDSWQFAQVMMEQCIFTQNKYGIKTNSLNGSLALESVNFAIPSNSYAIYSDGIGLCTIKNSEFAGVDSTSKVMYVGASHVQINFIGCQDENCGVLIENTVSDITGIINLWGNLVQSDILISGSCTINSMGNNYIPHCFKISGLASPRINSFNDNIRTDTGSKEAPGVIPAVPLTLYPTKDSEMYTENNTHLGYYAQRFPQRFISPPSLNGSPNTPCVGIGHRTSTSESKKLLRLGRLDSNQDFDFYYDIWRHNDLDDAGRLKIRGNQDFYAGFDFENGDLFVEGSIRSKAYALTDSTLIEIDPRASNHFYVTLAGNRTLNLLTLTGMYLDKADGQTITIELIQDATGSRTITLGSNIVFGTDITSITLSTAATKTDILTLLFSKRKNKWFVIDFKKGF